MLVAEEAMLTPIPLACRRGVGHLLASRRGPGKTRGGRPRCEAMPDPGVSFGDRGQALRRFAFSVAARVEPAARIDEMPDPSARVPWTPFHPRPKQLFQSVRKRRERAEEGSGISSHRAEASARCEEGDRDARQCLTPAFPSGIGVRHCVDSRSALQLASSLRRESTRCQTPRPACRGRRFLRAPSSFSNRCESAASVPKRGRASPRIAPRPRQDARRATAMRGDA
jgi:hypothetical protein